MTDTEAATGRKSWYLRRGDAIQGPFPAAQVGRYAILGRVLPGDEVSQDGTHWVPLSEHPTLLPAPLRERVDEVTLLQLRLREDERSGIDRRAGHPPGPGMAERRRGEDRRRPEPPEMVRRRQSRRAFLQGLRRGARSDWRIWVGLVAGSALVLTVALWTTTPRTPTGPRCNADPAPGVDWHDCRLERLDVRGLDLSNANLRGARARDASMVSARLAGADLAYADLAGAQLAGADLAGASLVGTNLSGVDLDQANLAGADLSYADLYRANLAGAILKDARLGRAVWVDGRVCGPDSLSTCGP